MEKRPDDPRAETPRAEIAVEIIALNKWFGEFHVLRDIDLKVALGERIVICGPSGSGKSTLLRCINHLENWQTGRIVVDGIELTDDPKQIVAVRRDVGMVFQQFNLFPASDRAGELHAGADLGAQNAQARRRGAGHEISRARAKSPSRRKNIRRGCPAANSSAWRSRARCA